MYNTKERHTLLVLHITSIAFLYYVDILLLHDLHLGLVFDFKVRPVMYLGILVIKHNPLNISVLILSL